MASKLQSQDAIITLKKHKFSIQNEIFDRELHDNPARLAVENRARGCNLQSRMIFHTRIVLSCENCFCGWGNSFFKRSQHSQPEMRQDSTHFSPFASSAISPEFGGISLPNNLLEKSRKEGDRETFQNNQIETAPSICRFLCLVVVEPVLSHIACHVEAELKSNLCQSSPHVKPGRGESDAGLPVRGGCGGPVPTFTSPAKAAVAIMTEFSRNNRFEMEFS